VRIEITLLFIFNNAMQRYLIALFFHCCLTASSQSIVQDWENYVLSVDGKPVSINVDLGFGATAPIKKRSYVIIVRTKIINPDTRGMPFPEEDSTLLQMEESLISTLSNATGAVFTGRFTQRGIREFYFYAPDTIGYDIAVNQAMKQSPQYAWLSKGKRDAEWENYFTVLYPTAMELLKIKSNRKIELIKKAGQLESKALPVAHTILFSDANGREKFLRNIPFQGFEILSMPSMVDFNSGKYILVLKRIADINKGWIDQFIIPLAKAAQMNGGKYLEWTTESQ
jgi:uncharacterized protein (TIGR01619 family)